MFNFGFNFICGIESGINLAKKILKITWCRKETATSANQDLHGLVGQLECSLVRPVSRPRGQDSIASPPTRTPAPTRARPSLAAHTPASAQQPCHVGPAALFHPITAYFRAPVGPGCSLSRSKSQVLAQSKTATCPAHSKLTNPLAPRGQSNPISFRRWINLLALNLSI